MAITRGIYPTIAHYVTVSTVIDIRGKKVVIRSMHDVHDRSEKEYTLVLPPIGSSDLKIALFTKEFIPSLLRQGYCPILKGNKVKLMPPHQDESKDPRVLGRLLLLCDQTIDLITKAGFENVRDFLQEFRDAVTKDDFPLAQELIENIREMRNTDNIERIYAVFLCLNHQPKQAAEVFKTLADRALTLNDPIQATNDLEDALVCNPKDEQTYNKLVRIPDMNDRRLMTYFLFAYLNESDPVIAEKWLASAKTYIPKDPLLDLADRKLDDQVACEQAKQCAKDIHDAKKSPRQDPNVLSLPTSPKTERRCTPRTDSLVSAVRSALSRTSSDRVEGHEQAGDTRVRVPLLRISAADTSSRTSGAETPGSSPGELKGGFLETTVKSLRNSFRSRSSRAIPSAGDLFAVEPHEKMAPEQKVSFKAHKLNLLNLLKEEESTLQKVKLNEVLKTLIEHYFEVKNWRKAEIIVQIMIQKFPTAASFLKYADVLKQANRKEEAVKLLFSKVIKAHASGCKDEVDSYLNKIDEIDPKWEVFTPNRKKILYMLRPTSERLQEFQVSASDTKQLDFISQRAFFMDHPKFVACHINEERLFLIAADHVYVQAHGQDKGVDYELTLPQDASATGYEVLSRKRSIQMLMKKGWMPVIEDGAVVLQEPVKKGLSCEEFKREAADILELLSSDIQNEAKEIKAISLLKEFLEVVDRSLTHAEKALKHAADCTLPLPLHHLWMRINKLYGDYLFARKKMLLAKTVYKNLSSKEKDAEQKRLYLERAFFCFPLDRRIAQELQEFPVSDAQKHFRELYAYLHLQENPQARENYQSASKNPWVQLAALNHIPIEDKAQRFKAFSQLANSYSKIDAELSTFYRICSWIENSTPRDLSEKIETDLVDWKHLKEKKMVALRIIDTLIRQGAIDEANHALKAAINFFQAKTSEKWKDDHQHTPLRFEGDGTALGRRELLLHGAKNRAEMKATASRLISLYTDAKKYAKVSAVAYLSFKDCKTFEKSCVSALALQEKKKEATQMAVEIAFSLICEEQFKRASKMLLEARNLDPDLGCFNREEKLLIQLMESACGELQLHSQ